MASRRQKKGTDYMAAQDLWREPNAWRRLTPLRISRSGCLAGIQKHLMLH